MCGIAGFFQTKYNISNEQTYYFLKNKLEKMKNAIKHRGPDDDDIYLSGFLNNNVFSDKTEFPNNIIGGFVGFAHSRLSIRDIKGGHQPMTRAYKNHKATIVYNGEIYNTDYLRKMLSSFNISFETTGDTEIILYCYLVFGTDIFKELNGIFSFVIYDNDTAIVVRDHIGVKPLFYYHNNREFVFSSEPKGIFAYGIKPMINSDSWCEIIGLGPAHTLGNGVFKDIKEVLPGHYLTVTTDYHHNVKVKDLCYWKLKAKPHIDDYNTTVDKCSYLITDSIQKQMVSDIPICTFLSGGLDSSLVSAIVQDNLPDKNLNTYSFDFVDNDINFKSNAFQISRDKPFVDIMVNHINSKHKYLECNNSNQIDCLFKAVDARDIPNMADVESSMLYFCNLVSKECRVTLTGECADEIFGGYPWFHRREMYMQNTFPWSYDLSPRIVLFKDDFINSLPLKEYVDDAYETSINQCPHIDGETITEYNRRKISWLNIRWFMMTLLNRMDRCSMYSGLEARVPFADYRILEYVFNVPWEYKCYNNQVKSLLVECGKKYLPPEILYRKKSPYPKTYDPTYEKLLGTMVIEEYKSNNKLQKYIDYNKLIKFINSPKDYGKPWYGQLMAGPQMLAYVLQISYMLRKYNL